ncbi:hypothetical protein EB155_09630 [archaeon]|nr:hypothetical protein [archaeon]NDB80110.1 hypothetical protein [archaeon]
MKNKLLFLIIFASNILFAQGKAGSLFLTINPGAKSNGMGEAQIGIANDVYASYYNPAGLTNLQSKQFSFMHTSYLPNLVDDMAYDFLTFAMPISNSESIGGYFSYLDLGDQISTDDNGNNIGSFSSYMYALNLSYAKKINDSSSWGVNGKYFYQELAVINSIDASKGSLAFDVSYFEENFLNNPNLNFGAILSNVGPEVSFDDGEKDPLPTRLGLGVSMLTLENKAMVALDLNYELNDSSMIYNFGAEYKIVDNFVARAGFINNSSGLGVQFCSGSIVSKTSHIASCSSLKLIFSSC